MRPVQLLLAVCLLALAVVAGLWLRSDLASDDVGGEPSRPEQREAEMPDAEAKAVDRDAPKRALRSLPTSHRADSQLAGHDLPAKDLEQPKELDAVPLKEFRRSVRESFRSFRTVSLDGLKALEFSPGAVRANTASFSQMLRQTRGHASGLQKREEAVSADEMKAAIAAGDSDIKKIPIKITDNGRLELSQAPGSDGRFTFSLDKQAIVKGELDVHVVKWRNLPQTRALVADRAAVVSAFWDKAVMLLGAEGQEAPEARRVVSEELQQFLTWMER